MLLQGPLIAAQLGQPPVFREWLEQVAVATPIRVELVDGSLGQFNVALVGFLGALVGAGVSLVATLLTHRHDRKVREDQRRTGWQRAVIHAQIREVKRHLRVLANCRHYYFKTYGDVLKQNGKEYVRDRDVEQRLEKEVLAFLLRRRHQKLIQYKTYLAASTEFVVYSLAISTGTPHTESDRMKLAALLSEVLDALQALMDDAISVLSALESYPPTPLGEKATPPSPLLSSQDSASIAPNVP